MEDFIKFNSEDLFYQYDLIGIQMPLTNLYLGNCAASDVTSAKL